MEDIDTSRAAPGVTEEMAWAFSTVAVAVGRADIATALLLCFFGLLRISEALNLLSQEIIITGSAIVFILSRTKRGIDQRVVSGAQGFSGQGRESLSMLIPCCVLLDHSDLPFASLE